MIESNLKHLAKFLVKAKIKSYAGEGKEITPERAGFKELEYSEGEYYYRDSYTGFFYAPGQEVVRLKGEPIWAMAYSGGMKKQFHGDVAFAKKVFEFLKECLKQVEESNPFRGPKDYVDGELKYTNKIIGDITNFKGNEKIFYNKKLVFEQDYIGGLIISK